MAATNKGGQSDPQTYRQVHASAAEVVSLVEHEMLAEVDMVAAIPVIKFWVQEEACITYCPPLRFSGLRVMIAAAVPAVPVAPAADAPPVPAAQHLPAPIPSPPQVQWPRSGNRTHAKAMEGIKEHK